jgi:hypothetical protein
LESDALQNIVKKFSDQRIGCISGEDHIEGSGGEGYYGEYELYIRNLESDVASIIGASGSFYAQRKELSLPFIEGMAPDLLSVLNIIESGYVAITEPSAIGKMTSVKKVEDEFNRKVRTFIRGMTVLFYKKKLLNPLKYGIISFELISHKIFRYLVPFFLIAILLTNILLIPESVFYRTVLTLQSIFYLLAILSFSGISGIEHKLWGKIPLYFVSVNYSIVVAWYKYLTGTRQEIWNPSKR